MDVLLDRPSVVRLYCYTHQAERSVAFALGAPWLEFLEYYHGERLDGLRRLRDDLGNLLPGVAGHVLLPTRQELGRTMRGVAALPPLLGYWITRWRSCWPFPEPYLRFVAATLGRLVGFLESSRRPEQEQLIELRMDLCFGRSVLEWRCPGMKEIRRARWLEHFWQAPWVTPVRLKDLLAEPHRPGPATKRSA